MYSRYFPHRLLCLSCYAAPTELRAVYASLQELNMTAVKKIVLDVLKPHRPDSIAFATAIANVGEGYSVRLVVLEMDENTETLQLEITAASIDFAAVQEAIQQLGGSLHSIDEVEVSSDKDQG